MLKKFCKWYLRWYLWDVYNDGWEDGVDQERFDPDSTKHYISNKEWIE